MSTPWKPDIQITKTLVETILRSQCPQLDLLQLRHVGAGWDHDVWHCGETVFRFPHQEVSLDVAIRHVDLLQYLSKKLPIPIPVPAYLGKPMGTYRGSFVGYRWIDGNLPAFLPLCEEDRAALAEPLANVLRTLHDIPRSMTESWGIGQAERGGELQMRYRKGKLRVDQLANGPYAELAAGAVAGMNPPPAEGDDTFFCLVHGDLHSGQLLLDNRHRLSGIIDWDELSIGDPAYDLMLVYAFIPPAARHRFWAIYGDFEGKHRARFIALSYGLAILAQAEDGGQKELALEAAFNLKNALDG